MEDIIPARKTEKRSESKPKQNNVLRVDYKLPARLRKPIHKQVKQSRTAKPKKRNAVNFERRTIMTELPSSKPPSYRGNRGAEHHTGDVYMKSRPDAKLMSPPYVSWRGIEDARPKKIRVQQRRRHLQSKSLKTVKQKANTPPPTPRRASKSITSVVDQGVRDVPYQFKPQQPRQAQRQPSFEVAKIKEPTEEQPVLEISQPRINILSATTGLKNAGHNLSQLFSFKDSKQVAFNVAVLLVGCIISYGLIWNLSGIGKGLQVLGNVQKNVDGAYGRLMSASVAMAETDFASSESGFSDAAQLINDAKQELDEAMSASQSILRYVDLTGTVRSGQELLSAGEKLSEAGVYISRGADSLSSSFGDKTFVEAISFADKQFKLAITALVEVEASFKKVDSGILPTDIQTQLQKIETIVPKARLALSGYVDQSDTLLALLGAKRDKQYLLLFQNNHEIRPTGGFIGSIGLVNIDRGTVEEVDISSVYDPDGQMRDYIEPPEPLKAVTNRWYMRDANWFIDFPTSARKVLEFFEKEGGPTVDGVVAFTPEVIREILKTTGPINVPEYGVEVSYDNFWRVTQDQVSYSYDKELNKPKQFLADLAPLLLNRLFESEATNAVEALGGLVQMIEQKHLLVYLHNEDLQSDLSKIGWSGEIPKEREGLLAINNANIAGHKSDQFIEQEVDYRLELMPDGSVEALVMIKREHRGDVESSDYPFPEDENPATKNNVVYQRVLVPIGAKLLEAEGFSSKSDINQMVVPESFDDVKKVDPDLVDWQTGQHKDETGTTIGQEAGYTFFANWLVTEPGQTTVAFYRYRLPKANKTPSFIDPAKRLEAYVVKQPGDSRSKVRVEFKLPENMRIIHTVPSAGTTQDSNTSLIYRSELIKDALVGVVFERQTN